MKKNQFFQEKTQVPFGFMIFRARTPGTRECRLHGSTSRGEKMVSMYYLRVSFVKPKVFFFEGGLSDLVYKPKVLVGAIKVSGCYFSVHSQEGPSSVRRVLQLYFRPGT